MGLKDEIKAHIASETKDSPVPSLSFRLSFSLGYIWDMASGFTLSPLPPKDIAQIKGGKE